MLEESEIRRIEKEFVHQILDSLHFTINRDSASMMCHCGTFSVGPCHLDKVNNSVRITSQTPKAEVIRLLRRYKNFCKNCMPNGANWVLGFYLIEILKEDEEAIRETKSRLLTEDERRHALEIINRLTK